MGFVSVLVWIFTALLLLLLVACIAASRGGIPRNHLFGIRLPALQRSDLAWRAGHRAGIVPAAVTCALALAFSAWGVVEPVAQWGAIVAFVGGVAWVMSSANHAAHEQG